MKKMSIFISYAREDESTATEIYHFLKKNNYEVWMDKFSLIPGQDWEIEISKAIENSDIFIACLSSNSVSKKGYVQKELKKAHLVLDEFPEEKIFIIPVLFDECIVPRAFSSKHWLKWGNPNSMNELKVAIEFANSSTVRISSSEKTLNVSTQSKPTSQSLPYSLSTTSSATSILCKQSGGILIVTVTKTETQAVMDVFSQSINKKWDRITINDKTYYSLGTHGGAPVYLVQSEMGTSTPGGSLITISQAIHDIQPQAVIMCGIAYGLRPDKQQLGDILVAKQLSSYEPQKKDIKKGKLSRGDRVTSSGHLLDRFRSGDNDWQGAKTHFGLILSGEKLVNDPAFRKSLLETEPEAIGGEMEGAGLYTAAYNAKVDWILVKAICDWADGNKEDTSQLLAALNSARFVLHVLQQGGWEEVEQAQNDHFGINKNDRVQQIQKSIKASHKDNDTNKKPSNKYTYMQNNNQGGMIRFLDSLDSARYSNETINENSLLLSILYVKAQFYISIITGDSIVITENQLFDSLGFLESFYELYQAANISNVKTDLPIKVALRENNSDVFQAVANNIGNESFKLALWKDLNIDFKRRKLWAEEINKKRKPENEIVLESEKIFLDELWVALKYFVSDKCISAESIPEEFTRRIEKIIQMNDDDLFDLYTGINNLDVQQRKYFSTKKELDAAKEIRNLLISIKEKKGKIATRSLIRHALLEQENQELIEGVIQLTDGIYNQTLGIATRATLVQSSTFPPRINDYVTAGYSLSTFIQDTSNQFNYYVNWELYSYDHFENIEGLEDKRRKSELTFILDSARKNVPWNKLILVHNNMKCQESLQKFKNCLTKLQVIEKNLSIGSLSIKERKEMDIERLTCQKNLKKYWEIHIKNVSRIAVNEHWNVTPTEILLHHPNLKYSIRISYSFLQTKIEMEEYDGFKVWRSFPSYKGRLDSSLQSHG